MSRRKKAQIREYHAGIDDWHLFMDDAKSERNKDEVASTRRSLRRARRELILLKKKGVILEASCDCQEDFVI